MSDVYRNLGVRPLINAAGTLTRLGGSRMHPDVVAAMAEAARCFVRLDELHVAVGRRIAAWAGCEAALVTSGAAAGLTLAAAACLAGDNFARMDRLPDSSGGPAEIIVARSHRNGYDHALRAAGARLVEVGLAERTRDPQPWEIAAAIGPETCAVAYFVGFSQLELDKVVEAARRACVPVIVDASAALPPRDNLGRFLAAGADLVTFSGGKGIGGPQASGILCGRRDLVASAALQMWDLDYVHELWDPPEELIDSTWVARGVPNHGLGRAMKVGKEELVGLAVALERFLAQDETSERARHAARSERLAAELAGIAGVRVSLSPPRDRWPLVWLAIDDEAAGVSAVELVRRLERGDPRLAVVQAEAPEGRIGLEPCCLDDDEVPIVVRRIRDELNQ